MKNRYSLLILLTTFLLAIKVAPINAQETSTDNNLKFCADPHWMPYEGIKEGKHVGIASDYLSIIQRHTNYTFELVVTNSWDESIALLKSGECHLTMMLNKTDERDKYLKFSNVYFRSPNILISQSEQPFLQDISHIGDRKVAMVKNYRIVEYVKKYHPNIKSVLVANEAEGVRAVAEGTADVFVGSMLSLNARVQQYGYGNIKIAGWGGPEDELVLA